VRRTLAIAAAAIAGAVVGGTVMMTVQARGQSPPAPPRTVTTPVAVEPAPTATTASPGEAGLLLLAWTPGGLPAGLDTAAAAVPGVDTAAIVRSDPINLVRSIDAGGSVVDEPAAGWAVPIDAIAIEPAVHASVVPTGDRAVVAGLGPSEAILSETSARLRRLGPGGRLEFAGGGRVAVTAIVPDETIGGAEVAVDVATGHALGVETPRALLVAHVGDRAAVEAAIAGAVPVGVPVRFRATGETPFLRAGDAVLPQAVVKDIFGEFAYRPPAAGERAVEVHPEWVAANIATAHLPLLGAVRCHRAVLPALEAAMGDLERAGLASVVPPGGFDGCWVPRLVQPGAALSHHSWGIALDLNYANNPTCVASGQDPRLVEALRGAGFGWGGEWLCPDPAHFEYVSPPARR
jgi:hypothetical protein